MYLLWIVRIHHNNDIKVVRNSTVHNVTIIRSSQCSMKCCGAGRGRGRGRPRPCCHLQLSRAGRGGQGWKVASCWLSVTPRDTWHVTLTTADGRQCVVTGYCKLLSSLSQSFTPPPVYTRRNIYNGHHNHIVRSDWACVDITSYKIYAAVEMLCKRIACWSLVKWNIN